MAGLVFMLAVLNLGLGYAAAMALAEPPLWSGWRRSRSSRQTVADDAGLRATAGERKPASERIVAVSEVLNVDADLPAVAGMDELPADWLAQLANEGVVAKSFVEASAHVVRLEVGRYREQLVAIETRIRASAEARDVEALGQLVDALRYLNQDWLDKQTAAADSLGQRNGRLGDHEQAATNLEQTLLDQAAHIRSACGVLQSLDVAADAENHAKQLIELVTSLLVHAHGLRDRILDLLATLIRAGNAVESYGAAVQRDAITGLPNRIGLEATLTAWWREDPQRTRLLSAVMVDIDRFGRVNQRLGTRAGDQTIVVMSRLIDETLAKDRGFERLVRIGGQSFLILLGDIGPHQALTAAERLRQSIEATTFDDGGTEFDLTISCGAIEVKHTESSLELVRRAQESLRFAKKAGRNRCALDKGEGPVMLDPPQFPVKGRVVSLRGMSLARSAEPANEGEAAIPVPPAAYSAESL